MSVAIPSQSIRFAQPNLDLFAAASHDRNPLHIDALYAHQTAYGERVVYGVLGALSALAQFPDQAHASLARLDVDFINPLYVDIGYTVEGQIHAADRVAFKIRDGSRVMLKGSAFFRPAPASMLAPQISPAPARTEPADWTDADLIPGLQVHGAYAPAWEPLCALMERWHLSEKGIGLEALVAMLWSSYVIGMEIPGKRALFSSLALEIAEPGAEFGVPLHHLVRLADLDRRFGRCRVDGQLSSGDRMLARAKFAAFIRPSGISTDRHSIVTLLQPDNGLRGKVALVTGASRGLGAAIAQALTLQGCTVFANYSSSQTEVEHLRAEMAGAPGELIPIQGNAGEPDWANEALSQQPALRALDFLICNAFPALQPLRFETAALDRINAYVAQSLLMVSAPLSVFMPSLDAHSGRAVVISSAAIDSPPPDWPHYVAAKYAVEGLAHAAVAAYPNAALLVVRPPRLLTDLTNTPLGRQDALSPEQVAVALVRRLSQPATVGHVELLDEF